MNTFRYVLKNNITNETYVEYKVPVEESNNLERNPSSKPNDEISVIEQTLLVEWIVENYSVYGASLALVSNKSPEGTQFLKGFGGIGGIYLFLSLSLIVKYIKYIK